MDCSPPGSSIHEIFQARIVDCQAPFITEKTNKEKREFYIPRLDREKSIYGTEFEVRLKNELTQKAIAKECADWIRRKARFKSNRTGQIIPGFMHYILATQRHTPSCSKSKFPGIFGKT